MRVEQTLIVLAILTAPLAGCTVPDASVSLYLTGEPHPAFDEVQLSIADAHVHRAGDATGSTGSGSEHESFESHQASVHAGSYGTLTSHQEPSMEDWTQLIAEPPVTAQLIPTQEDTAVYIGEADTQQGAYDQLDLELASAQGVQSNGTQVAIDLDTNSLLVETDFEVRSAIEARLVVTLDLDQNLTHQDDEWILEPHAQEVRVDLVQDRQSGAESVQPGQTVTLSNATSN